MKTHRPQSRWRRFVFGVTAFSVVFLVMLMVGEAVIRLAGFKSLQLPEHRGPINVFEQWQADKHFGFRTRARVDFINESIVDKPRVTTDEFGYRTTTGWSEEGEGPVVAIFGDSYMMAIEVEDDETPPSFLAKELDVRVLNSSCRFFNTLQTVRMMEETLDRYRDIEVAVYAFCPNDLQETMLTMTPIVVAPTVRLDEKGELIIKEVEKLAVAEGEPLRGCMLAEPSLADRVASYSALYQACRTLWWMPSGQRFLTDSDFYGWLDWARQNGGWEIQERLVLEMKEMCERRGVRFLATSIASINEGDTSPQEFEAMCHRAGIDHVAIYPHFTDSMETYQVREHDGLDMHYNVKGTKTFAKALAPAVRKLLDERREKDE